MTGLMDSLIIAKRDLVRNLRQKSQLFGAIIRPILWIFLLGTGLRNGFTGLPLGINLQQYAFPGIIAMNIFFTGVMSGASIIWDREFGFLKEIKVAPVSRTATTCGKVLSGSTLAILHGFLVLLLYPFLHLNLSMGHFILTIVAMVILALTATSLGVMLAAKISSIEGFGTINNFLVMPLFFLSGAMYPTTNVPLWLKYLTYFNPFTYGVDLLRGIVLDLNSYYLFDVMELILFTTIILAIASWLFNHEEK
jgi:ABC-2 type transport system permease protein